MTQIPRADPEVVKAIGREAKDLLENRAFATAVRTLHKQWLGELIGSQPLADKKDELIAQLRVLEAISQRLTSMVRDADFAQGGQNARGH
jgi:hypothetical protein